MRVFDSMALVSDPITPLIELQLSKIYKPHHSKSSIRVEIASVQQQEGVHECGLFAIAFAVAVCFDRKPESLYFNQKLMRKHLIKCLNNELFELFPFKTTAENIPRPTPSLRSIKLFCVCNMPECYDKMMIQCDNCNDWFHCSCVLPNSTIPDVWMCSICRSRYNY